LGVELYNLQRELGKLQQGVTKNHTELDEASVQRKKAEEELAQIKQLYEQHNDFLAQQNSSLLTFQKELDKLNSTAAQVEAHQQELSSKIKVSKRETIKTEEDVGGLEKRKSDQVNVS
jgi:predicted  nucleic acid-binding Zn-ribbon protein